MNSDSKGRGRRSRRRGSAAPFPDASSSSNHRSGTRIASSRFDTKALQLCRQVQRRLELALGELEDPVLQGLWVHSVVPEPGGRALLVELAGPTDHPVHEILARLDVVRGRLRAEVAASIHRKRTPHLHFMVVPAATPEEVLP